MAFNQFISIPGALWAPIVAERMTQQRKLVLGIGLLYLIGISCMLFNSNFIVLTLGTLILGFGQGASVSLAFTFLCLERVMLGKQRVYQGWPKLVAIYWRHLALY